MRDVSLYCVDRQADRCRKLRKRLLSFFQLPTFTLPGGTDSPGGPGGGYNGGGCNDDFRETYTFEYPFSELIIWAVLTKRKEMAKLMWRHGEQALSKALVASRLCQAMAAEAADDDLDVEIYEELSSFGGEFEELCECTLILNVHFFYLCFALFL
jgi:hypothetical protein